VGGQDWTEADAGLAEKPFCLADAASHRAVGVSEPHTLGVLSGKQQASIDRLAQQIGVGWVCSWGDVGVGAAAVSIIRP
jgi:hypothetical protein